MKKEGIKTDSTKTNYRTIDEGYTDCMLLSWGLSLIHLC